MALVTSRAIVLKDHRLGETSKVVVCYTRDYGKVRLVAKGVRKGGSRFGAALEPLMVSGVVFYLREGRDLSLVSQASIEREFPELRRDVVRMAMGGAVVELLERLLPDHEPDGGLYELTERTLETMSEAPLHALDVVLWRFMLEVACRLGYQPELSRCVRCGAAGCGGPVGGSDRGREAHEDDADESAGWAGFSPDLGGLVCDRCVSRGELDVPLPVGSEAAVLPVLAGEDGERLAAAGVSEGAVTGVSEGVLTLAGRSISPAARDDITRALGSFLEMHAGRSMRLKSLGFLAQVRRLEEPS